MIFVYKHETGTAISALCFLCISPSIPSQRTRKQKGSCFHPMLTLYFCIAVQWLKSYEMPLSGLQYSLRWQARGKHRVFQALTSDIDTGYRIQRVGHLIVLRPVAGFPAVPLFFVSSCFLHQKRDFQHLSASSLYQSRPLWNPLFLVVDVMRSTQKVSCLSVWTCVLCSMLVCVYVCLCVRACVCVSACVCMITVKRCHY